MDRPGAVYLSSFINSQANIIPSLCIFLYWLLQGGLTSHTVQRWYFPSRRVALPIPFKSSSWARPLPASILYDVISCSFPLCNIKWLHGIGSGACHADYNFQIPALLTIPVHATTPCLHWISILSAHLHFWGSSHPCMLHTYTSAIVSIYTVLATSALIINCMV